MRREPGFDISLFSTKSNFLNRIVLFIKLFIIGKQYDIFHIHGCSYWGFLPIVYGIIVGKFFSKKIVVTYHGGDAKNFLAKHPKITKFFLERADTILVPSKYLRSVFKNNHIEAEYIPNFIEVSNCNFVMRDIIRPNFIMTRSLESLYNHKLAMDAFQHIQIKYPDASLVILGEGSLSNSLIQHVQRLGIRNVEFMGKVSNHDVYTYLAKTDILLNTPVIDNMPISLLEAFASGVLVISSNVGGVPDLIEHGINGLMFESNNLNDLVEKINYALSNQEMSKNMIYNANKQLDNYSMEKVKDSLIRIYRN
jgi:glycosyltransferase involved in cell wall biosynthesis